MNEIVSKFITRIISPANTSVNYTIFFNKHLKVIIQLTFPVNYYLVSIVYRYKHNRCFPFEFIFINNINEIQ